MGTLVFPGYDPDPRRTWLEQGLAERETLRRNLALILDNADRILTAPRYFYCHMKQAFLSIPFVQGGPICLGVLVALWKSGKLIDTCKACGGNVYIIGAGGSAQSGCHKWWGVCARCGPDPEGSKPSFHEDIWGPIYALWDRYPNPSVFERGIQAVYWWKAKLFSRIEPDRDRPAIQGASISTVVRELSEGQYERLIPETLEEPLGGGTPSKGRLIPTGLDTLDLCLAGGLPAGKVTCLLCRRPEDARAILLTLAANHLQDHPGAVAYAGDERHMDLLAALARIRLGRGCPAPFSAKSPEDHRAYREAFEAVTDAPLGYISEGGHTSFRDLAASLQLMHESHPLGLALIHEPWVLRDFGQYLPSHTSLRSLGELAALLGVPLVIALRPPGEPGTGSYQPLALPDGSRGECVPTDSDACLLIERLPFVDPSARMVTLSLFVESHPVSGRCTVAYYDLDTENGTLHEVELARHPELPARGGLWPTARPKPLDPAPTPSGGQPALLECRVGAGKLTLSDPKRAPQVDKE